MAGIVTGKSGGLQLKKSAKRGHSGEAPMGSWRSPWEMPRETNHHFR